MTATEQYTHVVTALTVGGLRSAIHGLPDETLLYVAPADRPGNAGVGPDQVVVSTTAAGGTPANGTSWGTLTLETDYPSGTYERSTL